MSFLRFFLYDLSKVKEKGGDGRLGEFDILIAAISIKRGEELISNDKDSKAVKDEIEVLTPEEFLRKYQ